MKLQGLQIDSYKHLKNLNFPFTYPEGHENVGKPLNKICIIGQSATGKTSILELIKDNYRIIESMEVVNGKDLFSRKQLNFKGSIEYALKNESLKILENKVQKGEKEYKYGDSGGSVGHLINESLRILYLSSEIISKESINIFNKNPVNITSELTKELSDYLNVKTSPRNERNYIYEFVQSIDEAIWLTLLAKILDYRKRFTQMASELISKGAIGDMNRLNTEYARWAKANENPLESFSNYFNPVLKKLNLQIDLVNTEYVIPIKSKIRDEVIPISGLSTGTKGLLLSMFPLFELDTKDSIILLDEPERSLFPDMQIDLITHYQNLAPEAQLIVATHSPFIAASFEPEERFILYFDENGEVAVRRGQSPIGDDPNDILRQDFNIDYYNNFGKRAYQQYLDLKRKVSQETEDEKKKELIIELSELGDKYNF